MPTSARADVGIRPYKGCSLSRINDHLSPQKRYRAEQTGKDYHRRASELSAGIAR